MQSLWALQEGSGPSLTYKDPSNTIEDYPMSVALGTAFSSFEK